MKDTFAINELLAYKLHRLTSVSQEPIMIFLGGTAGNNPWRDSFITACLEKGIPSDMLFNPVVPDWNADAQAREDLIKKDPSTLMLYHISNPMQGTGQVSAYSLVEATMALYDHLDRTVVVFDTTGMTDHTLKSMKKIEADLRLRFPDAAVFSSPDEAIYYIVTRLRLPASKA
jgi:hypothetical protein